MNPNNLGHRDAKLKVIASGVAFLLVAVTLTVFMLPDEAHGVAFVVPSMLPDDDGRTMDSRIVAVGGKAFHEIALTNGNPDSRKVELYAFVTDVTNGGNASNWKAELFEYDGTQNHNMGTQISFGTNITIGGGQTRKVVLRISSPYDVNGGAIGQEATTEFYGFEGSMGTGPEQGNRTQKLTYTTILGENYADPELEIIGSDTRQMIPGDAVDTIFTVKLTNVGAKTETFSFLSSLTQVDDEEGAVRVERNGWFIINKNSPKVDNLPSQDTNDFNIGIRAPSYAGYGPHTIRLFFGGARGGESNVTIIAVIPEPDLVISEDRIILGRNPALYGQEISITAQVFNDGSAVEQDVKVRFLMRDESGGYINVGEGVIAGGILALETKSVTISFVPEFSESVFTEGGDNPFVYTLRVIIKVDPDGFVFESDTTNNDAEKDLDIRQKSKTKDSFSTSTILISGTLLTVMILSMAHVHRQERYRKKD